MKNRTKWLTGHRVQIKYVWIIIVSTMAPTLLLGACFYSLVFQLLEQQIAFPEAIMANLVPVINRVNMILLIAVPSLLAATAFLGLVVSNRLVGPVARVESELDEILAGDNAKRLFVRKGDDLGGIISRVNALLDRSK